MKKLEVQKIINNYYDDIVISETAKISSFIMDREYFLDVFEIRYERSIEINSPIKGFKEALDNFRASTEQEIQSISISDFEINITIYTDVHLNKVFGVLNFR